MTEMTATPELPASDAPAQPETVTIPMPDGNEVVMTLGFSGRDLLTVMELESLDTTKPQAALAMYPKLMAMIERHVVSHTYPDPDLLAALEPKDLVAHIFKPWQEARRDQAVPKPSGNRSQRRSQKRR